MNELGLSELEDARSFAPGDYVSFAFGDEQIISYLVPIIDGGLDSSEAISTGYLPRVVLSNGVVAFGITNLCKLQKQEIVMMFASLMTQPGNEHFFAAVERVCRG